MTNRRSYLDDNSLSSIANKNNRQINKLNL